MYVFKNTQPSIIKAEWSSSFSAKLNTQMINCNDIDFFNYQKNVKKMVYSYNRLFIDQLI